MMKENIKCRIWNDNKQFVPHFHVNLLEIFYVDWLMLDSIGDAKSNLSHTLYHEQQILFEQFHLF